MNTRFKSALDQVKSEDALVNKTKVYLKDALLNNANVETIKPKKWSLFSMKNKLAVASYMAFLLISGCGGAYAYYQTPVSYLSLDINPSIEIGINAFHKVVKVKGYNIDGQKILASVDIKGSNVERAVNSLVLSAIDNGFVESDGSTVVAVTSETDDKTTSTKLETNAETGVTEALKKKQKEAVINKDTVSLSLRKEAKPLGITPGKLNLIKKLQSVDSTATVEKYKNESVKNIMYNIKSHKGKGNVISKAKNTKDNVPNDNKKKITNKTKNTIKPNDNTSNKTENVVKRKTQNTNKSNIVNRKNSSTNNSANSRKSSDNNGKSNSNSYSNYNNNGNGNGKINENANSNSNLDNKGNKDHN